MLSKGRDVVLYMWDALSSWIHFDNHHTPHSACENKPPITQLTNRPDQYT